MSRDKQIEEIVKDFCPLYQEYGSCKRCNKDLDIDDEPCYYGCVANIIIDYDYHKASEVAEEIFVETHNMLVKVMRAVDDGLTKAILTDNEQAKLVHAGTKETLRCVILALAELKKKYTESEKALERSENGK
jgi:hypothetical protein